MYVVIRKYLTRDDCTCLKYNAKECMNLILIINKIKLLCLTCY